jgi:hypothetical protein
MIVVGPGGAAGGAIRALVLLVGPVPLTGMVVAFIRARVPLTTVALALFLGSVPPPGVVVLVGTLAPILLGAVPCARMAVTIGIAPAPAVLAAFPTGRSLAGVASAALA